jgi:hypothetical protein
MVQCIVGRRSMARTVQYSFSARRDGVGVAIPFVELPSYFSFPINLEIPALSICGPTTRNQRYASSSLAIVTQPPLVPYQNPPQPIVALEAAGSSFAISNLQSTFQFPGHLPRPSAARGTALWTSWSQLEHTRSKSGPSRDSSYCRPTWARVSAKQVFQQFLAWRKAPSN